MVFTQTWWKIIKLQRAEAESISLFSIIMPIFYDISYTYLAYEASCHVLQENTVYNSSFIKDAYSSLDDSEGPYW